MSPETVAEAELCRRCHNLATPEGLLLEPTYDEWLASPYSKAGVTCQDCHMPVVEGEVSVTGVLPNPRADVNRHSFRGGNFLMPRILNKHRADLAVAALPQASQGSISGTVVDPSGAVVAEALDRARKTMGASAVPESRGVNTKG